MSLYKKANDEDKAIMKETLDKLDIELDEDLPAFCIPTPTKISDIPMAEDDGLLEDADVEEVEVEVPVEDTEVEEPADETEGEAEEVEETTDEAETEEEVETIAAEEEPMTVGQFLDGFKDMDTEMPITINS